MAEEFRVNAEPDSAMVYYKKSADLFKEKGDVRYLIMAYNQMGSLLTRQDRYEEGRMYLGMAEIQGNTLPDTNDLLRASTFLATGVIYNAVGDYKGALRYHLRALNIRLQKLGDHNADVATCYGNIGNVYLNKKDLDHALEYHQKAMAIREKLFGEKSAEVVQSYYNIAMVYREKKEYENALQYLQMALKNKMAQKDTLPGDLAKYYKAISGIYYLAGNMEQGDLYKSKAEEP